MKIVTTPVSKLAHVVMRNDYPFAVVVTDERAVLDAVIEGAKAKIREQGLSLPEDKWKPGAGQVVYIHVHSVPLHEMLQLPIMEPASVLPGANTPCAICKTVHAAGDRHYPGGVPEL